MGDIIAILIAAIPNLIVMFGQKGQSSIQSENIAAQTIREYTSQVREMRSELAEVDKDRKSWQSLAEKFEKKLAWATEYIDRLTHQIRSLGHEPIQPREFKE